MENMTADEFLLLSQSIKKHSGINLKNEKKALLSSRLKGLLVEYNLSSFMKLFQLLKRETDGVILSKVIDRITTNHTYFMREAEHFKYLQSEVLPFLEQSSTNKDLRIWCAASSSGEEPFTLAMILEDYFGSSIVKWNKKLLATDISVEILNTAKAGVYHIEKVNKMPKIWLNKYFDQLDTATYQVKSNLRNEVIYRRFNLLEPYFPFKKKFHVIFCRNVMIYFDTDTKARLIKKFYDHLEYGGYLFIGHSETIDRSLSKFQYIRPAVYRKL